CHLDEPRDKCHTPETWHDIRWNLQDNPVVGVDWFDAYAYARWAGKDLPTEVEWERAATWDARGLPKRVYPWGDKQPEGGWSNFGNVYRRSRPVGKFEADSSPAGVMDLAGNVREWCLDWYDRGFYSVVASAGPDPKNLDPSRKRYRSVRGGAWNDEGGDLRGAARGFLPPLGRGKTIGFRCVLRFKRP
ncbi:MAG: formylglycine-generating enzyme family protein, partial [Planctomycetota bacterium]